MELSQFAFEKLFRLTAWMPIGQSPVRTLEMAAMFEEISVEI